VAEYNHALGETLVPYVGVEAGYRSLTYLDVEESAFVYGARGGLKVFIADNVAVEIAAAYKLAGSEVYVNDFVLEDSDLTYGVGFWVMWR
jgi:hypothetical protein